MARSSNLTKRLKDVESVINPPKTHKKCTVLRTDDGYICDDLKIKEPSKKKVINKALEKASRKRDLYIVIVDLRSDEVSNIDLNEEDHDRKSD